MIGELSAKLDGPCDEELDGESGRPVENRAVKAGIDEAKELAETKFPLEYEALAKHSEFHSMCANSDGSVVVFGGDENGDEPRWPLYWSDDGLKTVTRAAVQKVTDVVPDSSEAVQDNTEQWRTVVWHEKAKCFVAQRMRTLYKAVDGTVHECVCVWTSKTGKSWQCKVLEDAVMVNELYSNQVKLAYDAENGIVLAAGWDRIHWSKDCETWSSCEAKPGERVTVFQTVDVVEPGRYLAMNFKNGCLSAYGVEELKYDRETDSMAAAGMTYVPAELCPTGTDTVFIFRACTQVLGGKLYAAAYLTAGLIPNQPGAIGVLEFDPDAKTFRRVCALQSDGQTVRGMLAFEGSLYACLKNANGIAKVDIAGGKLDAAATSWKPEALAAVGGKLYVAGRSSQAMVYELDPETMALA